MKFNIVVEAPKDEIEGQMKNASKEKKHSSTYKQYKQMAVHGLIIFHYLLMVGVFCCCWHFHYSNSIDGAFTSDSDQMAVLAYTLLLFVMSCTYHSYMVGTNRIQEIIYSQAIANLVSWTITVILVCAVRHQILNPLAALVFVIIQLLISAWWSKLANTVYFRIHKPKSTVIFYRNKKDLKKLEDIYCFNYKWKIEKKVCCLEQGQNWEAASLVGEEADTVMDGNIFEIIQIINEYECVFVSGLSATLRNGIVKHCVDIGRECYFIPHTGDVIVASAQHVKALATPIYRVRRKAVVVEYAAVKRLMDIVLSCIALVVAAPFALVTALAIKLHDRGPVLYKQVRLTKDGKEFTILKFRSMRIEAEKDGVARLASENDDRITPVGRVIRAIRFDEIPQLVNILRGDMSIVGPRPERPEIAAQYEETLPAFRLRLQVKAGLTGYAQVYGRYNTEPADKLKMDLMYINNIGLMEDLRLMFVTVKTLFVKESTQGIEDGSITAMDYQENEEQAAHRETAGVR